MTELIAFDLDGTIVDTMPDITGALNRSLAANGLPELTRAQVEAIVGYSTAYMFQNAVPKDRPDAWQAVGETYDPDYRMHCCDHSQPFVGVIPMLEKLKEKGVRLAVVSNKPHRDSTYVIGKLFPRNLFDVVLGRVEKFETKPAPEALHFVLDYLGVKPENAIYVGDSDVDVQFAKNAGLRCLSVCWGYRSKEELIAAGATQIVDTVDELSALLLQSC